MTKQDKAPQKKRKNLRKNDLPVLDSDQDLLAAFMDSSEKTGQEKKTDLPSGQINSQT
jgi:hypothetical protein